MDGLAPTTRKIVARFRENENRQELPFDRVFEYHKD